MPDWKKFISRDPEVMMGKPIFRDTRLTVEFVLERLGQGATQSELIENYEGLTENHIRAAISYAASVIRHDEMVTSE